MIKTRSSKIPALADYVRYQMHKHSLVLFEVFMCYMQKQDNQSMCRHIRDEAHRNLDDFGSATQVILMVKTVKMLH